MYYKFNSDHYTVVERLQTHENVDTCIIHTSRYGPKCCLIKLGHLDNLNTFDWFQGEHT